MLIGLASSGVHSNGYSLVRKTLDINEQPHAQHQSPSWACTLGEALLAPTQHLCHVPSEALSAAGVDVQAISHITGGGFYENMPRMHAARHLTAHIDEGQLSRCSASSSIIQKTGSIPERDMYNTFNMGVGMIIAVPMQPKLTRPSPP